MQRNRNRPLPLILERRSSDEFDPPPYDAREIAAVRRVAVTREAAAAKLGVGEAAWAASRRGTAAGLLALKAEYGDSFYEVPPEAALDDDAAREAFADDSVVIDVQTHYVADRPETRELTLYLLDLYRSVSPDWWKGMDGLTAYNLAEYLRCVFLETENAVAVLTSGPGRDGRRMLFNPELAMARELLDRLGPEGRVLQHAVVPPDFDDEFDRMEEERDRFAPAGWKVYTLGRQRPDGSWTEDWMLDDETVGVPFLERCRALGTPLVCTHKGISNLAPAGSPRDVGPAAAGFPDVQIVVYHSGYEMPSMGVPHEGPYSEGTADLGVNRLVKSLAEARIAPGSNVCAELGSTWFCLVRRPAEAAHVLGKLLRAVGEDNVLWGTDSIWYGPAQPVLDAFRAFQIPPAMRDEFGYPELTPEIKAKILGRNGARLYGIDLERAKALRESDDLAWMTQALDEAKASGIAGVVD